VYVDRCDECGFEFDLSDAEEAGRAIVEGATKLAQRLNDRTADLAARPAPETWSPLEYGCHTRDVLIVQRERVLLARRVDRADPPAMGREERVEHDGYADQRPEDVARQLTDAARLFANVLSRLDSDDWERIVVYDLEPPERSLRWVAVDTWHEVRHHHVDVLRQLT